MNYDKTDLTSLITSAAAHVLIVLLLSSMLMKIPPKQVALITDVTLIDMLPRAGEKGEEKKTVGLEKKQVKKTATAIKKKTVKKPVADVKMVDTKALLKKIEEEKAKLDLGISRSDLRQQADENAETVSQDDSANDITEENAVAGGEPLITGALATRKYKKITWKFPEKLPEETELMVEITVLSSGIIKNVKLLRTSGYPELDRAALLQARKLQFDPLPYTNDDQAGVLLFKFGVEK
jgi:TonB family protein